MTKMRRFIQCDVFSDQPCKGNGLAVVIDGDGLSTAEMQAFASWTQLSEATFICAPKDPLADYELRIFAIQNEMKFAGHPTLGSAMAWLKAGGKPKTAGVIVQECGVGLVEIDVQGARPYFVAPPTSIKPMDQAVFERVRDTLALDGQILSAHTLNNGPEWQVFELMDAEAVRAVNSQLLRGFDIPDIGLIGAYPSGADADFEVRMLDKFMAQLEDPITGSLNAALASWLKSENRLPQQLVIRQGRSINRDWFVYVEHRDDRVRIGGDVQIVIDGEVRL